MGHGKGRVHSSLEPGADVRGGETLVIVGDPHLENAGALFHQC